MKKVVLLLLPTLLPLLVKAQVFGGNPPSLKWKQINTDTVRVIFPAGLEAEAQRVANTVLYINKNTRGSIGNKELKLNLVLQNQTTASNGYVALAPFRSEFQVTPPQQTLQLGSLDWLHLLPVHEYRHALQNMNFRVGLGKTFYYLFGQDGQALVTNALVPDWFWEGDAVFMETSLSTQGRGRLPSFFDNFRGLYFENKHYRYAKIRNGSLKDMVPNHYPLGYIMTAYGREKYGKDFWKNIMNESLLNRSFIKANNKIQPRPFHLFKYGFYPLSAALHYTDGHKLPGFYKEATAYFQQQWQQEEENLTSTPARPLFPDTSKRVVSYEYPYYLPDGSLLTVKSSYASTPEIITLDSSGREHPVVKMGMANDDYFSYNSGRLVWAESRFDPRWGWKDFSVIRLYDLNTKKSTTLTHRTKYFAPDISHDGKRVVVAEATPGLQYRLKLLDAANGKLLKELPDPDTLFYTYPKFSADDQYIIAAVKNRHDEMALMRQNISDGSITYLTPFVNKAIGPPAPGKDYIFFPAAFTHAVNIYAVSLSDGKAFRVTSRLSSDYSITAAPEKHEITYSEFSVEGNKLQQATLDPGSLKPVDWAAVSEIQDMYVPGALKQEGGNILDKIPRRNLAVKKYSKGTNLVSVNSWVLLPNYPEIGLYLQSENILNTLQSSIGAGYNFNEGSPFISFSAIYGAWFPQISATAEERFNRNGYTTDNKKIFWNETNFSGGVSIPLDLSANLYNRRLTIGTNINMDHLQFLPGQQLKKTGQGVSYLGSFLQFSNARIMARQNIYPKFAQSFSVNYNHTLGSIYAMQLTTSANFFFPGLFENHSLYFNTGYALQDTERRYSYTDDFVYSRGYNSLPYHYIYKIGANYQLPLAYPDFGATWLYLPRIRMNVFFDYSRAWLPITNGEVINVYRSAGTEIYFDTRWFKYLSIPIGIRYSYLLDRDFQEPGRTGRLEISIPLQFF